jgi:hypothetical protein
VREHQLHDPFMRMNDIDKKDVEDFVVALNGKGLSVRESNIFLKDTFGA